MQMSAPAENRRPADWNTLVSGLKHRWLLPFRAFEWIWEWVAYALSRWSFLEVLDHLGRLSLLVGVIFYFHESGARIRQRHDQAWQVINTAQGKGGSGGRIEALQSLNADKVPLVGVDASGAFLQGVHLDHANLLRADLSGADLRGSSLREVNLSYAHLHDANFRGSSFEHAVLSNADMADVDMVDCDLTAVKFDGADLASADLRFANLKDIEWKQIAAIKDANIAGVKNAPDGFREWALSHGAVESPGDDN
jgi:Pentapeptide repeats (9 copies)